MGQTDSDHFEATAAKLRKELLQRAPLSWQRAKPMGGRESSPPQNRQGEREETISGAPVQAARQLKSKPVSVAMLLQVIVLPSHMACAQVPT